MRCAHLGLLLGLGLAGCNQLFGVHWVGEPADGGTGDGAMLDGAPSKAQLVHQTTTGNASATSIQVALASSPAMGDVLVMLGAAASNPLNTPTGGGVSQWNVAARSLQYRNVEIWYGVVDTASSPVVISCPTQGEMWMSVTEWSGLMTTALLEHGSAANGTGSTTTPGSAGVATFSTIDAPDLLIFSVSGTDVISTQVSDGTWQPLDRAVGGSVTQAEWYQLVGAGPHAPHTTVTSNWDAALAAFRATP